MTYTNEIEVEIDLSDVDPILLDKASESDLELVGSNIANSSISDPDFDFSKNNFNLGLGSDKPKLNGLGANEKFFKR